MSRAPPRARRSCRPGALCIAIPDDRGDESFADDLNMGRGIVSGRVALLLRSAEIPPHRPDDLLPLPPAPPLPGTPLPPCSFLPPCISPYPKPFSFRDSDPQRHLDTWLGRSSDLGRSRYFMNQGGRIRPWIGWMCQMDRMDVPTGSDGCASWSDF